MTQTKPEPSRPILDRRSLIDVSLAAALMLSAFHVGQKMEEIEGSLKSLDKTLTDTTNKSATKQDFELFKMQLRAENPGLVVPK